MGGGRGKHYGMPSDTSKAFLDNYKRARRRFGTSSDGRLGEPGKRKDVQVIYSAHPVETAKEVFRLLSDSAVQINTSQERIVALFEDDTYVVLRLRNSSAGGPVVDLNPGHFGDRADFMYKIHFEIGEN